MPSATLSQFEDSLSEKGVSVTRVCTSSFQQHLNKLVDAPAVGVALGDTFDNVSLSLSETDVTIDPTPAELRSAEIGITWASIGIADYGSLVLTLTDAGSELVSLFVERHIVVIREADLLDSMKSAIDVVATEFNHTPQSAIIATGPSATADMGALVKGAHGPRDVQVLILTEDAK
ncbi:LUD domain-containing protein [Halocatena marina]|uniref:LUD domain-containing protein n=1 Tax=Halocatena marina TaxID=2934937 RepID=A0ABD5YX63_9EURY|nr:LUD domain-containing protein [Halocatena marina]